jgi:predicted dehydrogenase
VAVIGCGWAGRRHAAAYLAAGARVAWAVDPDPARVAALPGAGRAAADWAAALADPAVAAVSVCLPHHLHRPAVVAAAAAGKHVLCEKPLAGSLADADEMAAAADRAGVTLMVAENVRFDPLVDQLEALVAGGAVGPVAVARMSREADLAASFLGDRRWFLDAAAASGGMLLSGGIHDVDVLLRLLGQVQEVYAVPARQRLAAMQGEDTALVTLRFVGGAVAVLLETAASKQALTAGGVERHTLVLDGEHGQLAVEGRRISRWPAERPDAGDQVLEVPEADTFALEVAHFLDCLRAGREPLTSARRQRRALEVVLAAYTSIAGGQPVAV